MARKYVNKSIVIFFILVVAFIISIAYYLINYNYLKNISEDIQLALKQKFNDKIIGFYEPSIKKSKYFGGEVDIRILFDDKDILITLIKYSSKKESEVQFNAGCFGMDASGSTKLILGEIGEKYCYRYSYPYLFFKRNNYLVLLHYYHFKNNKANKEVDLINFLKDVALLIDEILQDKDLKP